jgi:signal transduction histidine kinase
MRNSLIFKLLGAFLLVIAIGALVISILTTQATQSAFSLYTTRSGQAWAQRLAPQLADYYTQNSGWTGVDAYLQSGLAAATTPAMMSTPGGREGMGGGMGQGRGVGAGMGGGGMAAAMGQRLILTDGQGKVISDTQNELVGKQLPATTLEEGASITVNNSLVGTLVVSPSEISEAGAPATEFLASVNRAIISSAVIAAIIALILGAVLFISITAPLRQLKKAAAAIAGGDLSQRVKIVSHDELGELGATFNHMAASLASAETQRQHLAADIAHELRTPLAAMQATLEGMQDGVLPLDEEQVAALHAESALLNRLIGDLRLLSLAEAGQLHLEAQETDAGELIQRVVDRIKPQADQKKIRLETDIQGNLPAVLIDADRITQVLNNLIGNAMQYTPPEGAVTIQVSRATGSRPGVQVSVTDSGPGIAADALPFIFDRFYRADKSRARTSGGSGLGLAIVKQLVAAHGGEVWADSPIFQDAQGSGYGTRITFTLNM